MYRRWRVTQCRTRYTAAFHGRGRTWTGVIVLLLVNVRRNDDMVRFTIRHTDRVYKTHIRSITAIVRYPF